MVSPYSPRESLPSKKRRKESVDIKLAVSQYIAKTLCIKHLPIFQVYLVMVCEKFSQWGQPLEWMLSERQSWMS